MKVYVVIEDRYGEDPWSDIRHSCKLHGIFSTLEKSEQHVHIQSSTRLLELQDKYKSGKWIVETYLSPYNNSLYSIDIRDSTEEYDTTTSFHIYEREVE